MKHGLALMLGGMDEGKDNPILLAAASDLLQAIHAKDAKGIADALESAFSELDNDCEPDGMGPPDEDDG